MTKLYKVQASYVTYLSVDVEADSEEQARDIARELDGGDFNIDTYGAWNIDDVIFQCEPKYSNQEVL